MESRNKIKSDAIYKEKIRQRIIQLKGTLNSLKLELIRESDLLDREKEELRQLEELGELEDEMNIANRGMRTFTHDDLPSDEFGEFDLLTKLEEMRRQQYELRARNFQQKLSEVEVQCDVAFSKVQDTYKPLMQLSSEWSALEDLISLKSNQQLKLEKQRSMNKMKSNWECLVEMMKRRQERELSSDGTKLHQVKSFSLEPFPNTSYTSFGGSDSSQESFVGSHPKAICGHDDNISGQEAPLTSTENFWYNRYLSEKLVNSRNVNNDSAQRFNKDYNGNNNDLVEQAISFAFGKPY